MSVPGLLRATTTSSSPAPRDRWMAPPASGQKKRSPAAAHTGIVLFVGAGPCGPPSPTRASYTRGEPASLYTSSRTSPSARVRIRRSAGPLNGWATGPSVNLQFATSPSPNVIALVAGAVTTFAGRLLGAAATDADGPV